MVTFSIDLASFDWSAFFKFLGVVLAAVITALSAHSLSRKVSARDRLEYEMEMRKLSSAFASLDSDSLPEDEQERSRILVIRFLYTYAQLVKLKPSATSLTGLLFSRWPKDERMTADELLKDISRESGL